MEVRAQDIVDSVDLSKSEAFLPLYESIVNSIISLLRTGREDGKIDVFIEREALTDREPDLFDKKVPPIKSIEIVDNGEGFTEENFLSFNAPYSRLNKKYGCKGIGRFTMLAMFSQIRVVSTYKEGNVWFRRKFVFDGTKELVCDYKGELDENEEHELQTKVKLVDCNNKELKPFTARNAEEIAKGVKNHCFIYYLCGQLPTINIIEQTEEGLKSLDVKNYFTLEQKDKEKEIEVRDEKFLLYVVKSPKENNRKYNYVYFCANSRTVGGKRDLSKVDNLFLYPILEHGESVFLDIYVVSDYLDAHINNSRTSFKIPDSNGEFNGDPSTEISMEEILIRIAEELAGLYETFVLETKKRTVLEAKQYIETQAPQYRSFLLRQDVLNRMPPHLSAEKKEEFFHREAVMAEKKLEEKINAFIEQKDYNDEQIGQMVRDMREKSAYDMDKLTDYVMRRKAVIKLFRKMLDAKDDGKYELESLIHNLIFPMGLTNKEVSYQYHNLWLLDERFATYQFIASDKSITSFSKVKSSLEPDLVLINNEEALVDNPISYGSGDAGDVESMVIFEFKRPGQTAHQKKMADKSWEFSDLVDKYFDAFLYGSKKNYRGNFVNITSTTPKFGYVIMDVIDKQLEDYNLTHGWKKTPFGSYYKINPDLNLHIEAITFQNLLKNVEKRMSPFFDHLFTEKV
jgi:hypothetical protein